MSLRTWVSPWEKRWLPKSRKSLVMEPQQGLFFYAPWFKRESKISPLERAQSSLKRGWTKLSKPFYKQSTLFPSRSKTVKTQKTSPQSVLQAIKASERRLQNALKRSVRTALRSEER